MYSEWTQGVDEVALTNLEKPLLLRSPESQLISVNFDPKVMIGNNLIFNECGWVWQNASCI